MDNVVAFKMIEGKRSTVQRMVYALGNLMGVGLAVYKCQVMGLLPTHASDWLAFVEPQKVCFDYNVFFETIFKQRFSFVIHVYVCQAVRFWLRVRVSVSSKCKYVWPKKFHSCWTV